LDEAHDEIRAAGGDVVAVFQYRAGPTRNFCRQRKVDLDCLGDPDRQAYHAVGLEQGSLMEVAGPQLVKDLVRAGRKGSLPGIPVGDVTQRPGTFVVAPDGRVALAHYNRDSSDHPPMGVVMDAVRSSAAA
jgi:peroxiredoxin